MSNQEHAKSPQYFSGVYRPSFVNTDFKDNTHDVIFMTQVAIHRDRREILSLLGNSPSSRLLVNKLFEAGNEFDGNHPGNHPVDGLKPDALQTNLSQAKWKAVLATPVLKVVPPDNDTSKAMAAIARKTRTKKAIGGSKADRDIMVGDQPEMEICGAGQQLVQAAKKTIRNGAEAFVQHGNCVHMPSIRRALKSPSTRPPVIQLDDPIQTKSPRIPVAKSQLLTLETMEDIVKGKGVADTVPDAPLRGSACARQLIDYEGKDLGSVTASTLLPGINPFVVATHTVATLLPERVAEGHQSGRSGGMQETSKAGVEVPCDDIRSNLGSALPRAEKFFGKAGVEVPCDDIRSNLGSALPRKRRASKGRRDSKSRQVTESSLDLSLGSGNDVLIEVVPLHVQPTLAPSRRGSAPSHRRAFPKATSTSTPLPLVPALSKAAKPPVTQNDSQDCNLIVQSAHGGSEATDEAKMRMKRQKKEVPHVEMMKSNRSPKLPMALEDNQGFLPEDLEDVSDPLCMTGTSFGTSFGTGFHRQQSARSIGLSPALNCTMEGWTVRHSYGIRDKTVEKLPSDAKRKPSKFLGSVAWSYQDTRKKSIGRELADFEDSCLEPWNLEDSGSLELTESSRIGWTNEGWHKISDAEAQGVKAQSCHGSFGSGYARRNRIGAEVHDDDKSALQDIS